MKHNLSISIEQDLVFKIFDTLRSKEAKSRSEVVEKALKEFFEKNARRES